MKILLFASHLNNFICREKNNLMSWWHLVACVVRKPFAHGEKWLAIHEDSYLLKT
jgi:hypothetical protein